METDKNSKMFISIQEAADLTGISTTSIRCLTRRRINTLPHVIIGKKKVLIKTSDLEKFLDEEIKRTIAN